MLIKFVIVSVLVASVLANYDYFSDDTLVLSYRYQDPSFGYAPLPSYNLYSNGYPSNLYPAPYRPVSYGAYGGFAAAHPRYDANYRPDNSAAKTPNSQSKSSSPSSSYDSSNGYYGDEMMYDMVYYTKSDGSRSGSSSNTANGGVNITWKYEAGNPDVWKDLFPACDGESQSPINIVTSQVSRDSSLAPIEFHNYGIRYLYNFTNFGKSVVGNVIKDTISGSGPFITGSNFGSEIFNLIQFHFHWGTNPSTGSEHTVDGKSYSAELHLVHSSAEGNYTVVGFFFELDDKDNSDLDKILKAVSEEDEATHKSFTLLYLTLEDILPDLNKANNKGYYRYRGSLTAPPCTEGIIWNVYRQTIKISRSQLKAFYRNAFKFNNRPVQPKNGRKVYLSVPN